MFGRCRPQICASGSHLSAASLAEAFPRPRSLDRVPALRGGAAAFSPLARILRRLPCYRLALGPEPREAVRAARVPYRVRGTDERAISRGAGALPGAVNQTAVSVVVPVHDGARYLEEALRSAVSQRPRPLEVIVVDDHSSDDSVAVAARFGGPVTVIAADRRGAAAARNLGVKTARGALVAFLDADDRWRAGALANLRKALFSEPRASIAHGRLREFCSPDIPPEMTGRLQARPGTPYGFIPGSFLVRADAFEKVGALDSGLRAGEMADWMARLRDLGLVEAWTEEVVLERRVHAGHLSAEKRVGRADLLKVVRSALARRRSGQAST